MSQLDETALGLDVMSKLQQDLDESYENQGYSKPALPFYNKSRKVGACPEGRKSCATSRLSSNRSTTSSNQFTIRSDWGYGPTKKEKEHRIESVAFMNLEDKGEPTTGKKLLNTYFDFIGAYQEIFGGPGEWSYFVKYLDYVNEEPYIKMM